MATAWNFSDVAGKNLSDLRKKAYQIDKIEYLSSLNYEGFFNNHLVPNCPCIFSAELTELWRSRAKWVDENGSPNFSYLTRKFGTAVVPVADCKQEQYSAHPKQDWTLSDYTAYWQKYRDQGYPPEQQCLYLKDWHFTKEFPDYEAYSTPVFFQSDWLNEYWDTLPQDDYRFVYMGPKGTWTPFHSDVYRSFSWSANICGRKKWIFYPPGCEECLKDRYGQLVYDVTSPDLEDTVRYPRAAEVKDKVIEVIQEQGEVIFVPSGWHHQVINLEDTISINHNWLNGCNVDISWRHLVAGLAEVKVEIADCHDMDGWHEQCQLILKASAGIDFQMFLEMLEVIASNRTHMWQQLQEKQTPQEQSHIDFGDATGAKDNHALAEMVLESSGNRNQKCNVCKNTNSSTGHERSHDRPATEGVQSTSACEQEQDGIHSKISPLCECEILKFESFTDRSKTEKARCDKSKGNVSIPNSDNNLLCSKDFIFYDLMRLHEVLHEMLANEDLQRLSPDYKVRVNQIIDSILGCLENVE